MKVTHVASAVLLAAVSVHGQSPSPTFDVVSVKRNTSGSQGTSFDSDARTALSMLNGRVITLIRLAYPTQNDDVPGAPDWTRRERYDVIAKAEGRSTNAQIRTMLRAMLAERFKLAVHMESRELPVFALVLAAPNRGVPAELRPTKLDCAAREDAGVPGASLPDASNGAPGCGYRQVGGDLNAGGTTMGELAEALGGLAGRIVIDRTGLSGRFEFTLHAADVRSRGPEPTGNDAPAVSTALQEQLGLKLEPLRAPIETLVIDRIERPADN